MKFPKPIMKSSELKKMGFPEEFLLTAYRAADQTFASKINPEKENSSIVYDTAGLEAWWKKQIRLQAKMRPKVDNLG